MIHKWKFISRQVLLDHPRMTVVEDEVELPTGKKVAYILEPPSSSHSVAIVALNSNGQILVQREYSYPIDNVMYQLPGGAAKDGEDIIVAANRELSEECGYIANKSQSIGSFYVNNRRSDRKQFVVLCENLEPRESAQDEEEFIENEWMDIDKVKQLVQEGKIENVNFLAALTLVDSFRA